MQYGEFQMNNNDNNFDNLISRAEQREKKKRHQLEMKVSGKKVFDLQRLIRENKIDGIHNENETNK
jgi:hypothetical protein